MQLGASGRCHQHREVGLARPGTRNAREPVGNLQEVETGRSHDMAQVCPSMTEGTRTPETQDAHTL